MEYTEIVLKLVNDMIKLEKKVHELELTVSELMNENDTSKKVNSGIRSFSKDETISLLKSKGSKVGIEVEKASMSDGGGITTKYKDQKTKKVMLKSSRNYSEDEVEDLSDFDFIGWHRLPAEALESFDAYVFTVAYKDDIELFTFSPEQLKKYVSDKNVTHSKGSKVYHFSFGKDKNGNYIDIRERDNIKSISEYNNNWAVFK